MSESAVVAAAPARDSSFLLRKLHSLTGVVPVGLFLLFHLFENTKLWTSPEAYEGSIRHLWDLAPRPLFYAIEVGLLAVPILFHALYGFRIWYQGESNTARYGYARNWMYTAQRWSGLIAFVYMLLHVWWLRVAPDGNWALARPDDASLTTFGQVARAITPIYWTALYLVGGIAAAFHFGNGLFGFAYSWGLAVGRKAQQRVELLGWIVFLALSAAVIATVFMVHVHAGALPR